MNAILKLIKAEQFSIYLAKFSIYLAYLACLLYLSCSPNIVTYPIQDSNRIQHQYNISITSTKNEKLTQFCAIHHEWEDIHTKWGIENNEFGWSYRVIKHK